MRMKSLLVMPGKEVQIVKIHASIKYIKSFIGEELYKVKLNENTLLIANKNAPVDEFNRILGENILLGTFLIVSVKSNHIVPMKKKAIRKFTNMFRLKKHKKKVERYKEEYLEEYYSKQKEMKQKNAERNKKEIFSIAA